MIEFQLGALRHAFSRKWFIKIGKYLALASLKR